MDFAGRPCAARFHMAGKGLTDYEDLAGWIDCAVRLTTMPPKAPR
jgi:hypothetical protein